MERSDAPLRRDFRKFLFVVWRRLGLPPPTPVQYDIAQYLQHGPRRKVVMAFRGVGKTSIYAAFALWRLYCAPDAKILVVSASKSLADAIATFVKRLIDDTPAFAHLRPGREQRDGAALFDVGPARPSKDPSLRSVGIGGQITGSRADEILADDVESAGNATTEAARRKLAEQIKEFDAVLKPGGAVTYLGTPQSTRSIYLALPERGYDARIWPAEAPADPAIYGAALAPFVAARLSDGLAPGAPIDPERFDAADLAERRASYGPSGYALQFLIDARATDAARHPLRLSDLLVLDLDAERAPNAAPWSDHPATLADDLPALGIGADRFRRPAETSRDRSPYSTAVMAIDPSGRGADETAYAVVKELNARLFLTDAGGFSGGYAADVLSGLAAAAKAARAPRIVVEANFGDGMFAQLLRPALDAAGVSATLEEARSGVWKERRILDVLEPVFAQHRLIVDAGLVARDAAQAAQCAEKSLFFQITRLAAVRGALAHDDRVDALALAVGALAPRLSRDVERAAEAERARRLRDEVRTLLAPKRRGGPKRARWT